MLKRQHTESQKVSFGVCVSVLELKWGEMPEVVTCDPL